MSKPELDPEIRELMDACRAGSDDLAEPEMAALGEILDRDSHAREILARSTQLDRSIGEAFRDVQPPPGLAARLLAALGAEEELSGNAVADSGSGETDLTDDKADLTDDKAADIQSEPAGKVSPANRTPQLQTHQGSRRRWIILAGTLAASVVVVVYAAVLLNQPAGPVPHSTVADKAIAWLDKAEQGDWSSSDQAPVDSYPLASSITIEGESPTIAQWQFITTEYGKAAVYDLTPAGKGFVYLFAVRSGERFSAPQLLPSRPARTTQGVCIGVAYQDGILHVLVVDGDERRYRDFIRERLPVI